MEDKLEAQGKGGSHKNKLDPKWGQIGAQFVFPCPQSEWSKQC